VRILLDTHLVLWAMQDSKDLSAAARALLDEADIIYVSAASLWEIAIKAGLGKLQVDGLRLAEQLDEAGFEQLPITWAHGIAVKALPPIHLDPFDRMLIAQAISEPLRLLTHDAALARYSDLVTVV
jgi:PIN domain nuclease of toxin-antitoxin system